jgi:WD40 repeat protein
VRLWTVSDGKLVKTLNTNDLVRRSPDYDEGSFGELTSLTLSPDGKLLAVSGYLNPLQPAPARAGVTLLISVDDGVLQRILLGGGGYSAFSADGRIFYSSGDGAVHQWGILP